MKTLEAWVAELEMEVSPAPNMITNPSFYHYNAHENVTIANFAEQFSETHAESFTYPYSMESNINTPDEWDLDHIFNDQFSAPFETSNKNEENYIIKTNSNQNERDENLKERHEKKYDEKVDKSKNQEVKGGAKRKRPPSQVQDHIIAERKRREMLSQLFISLSANVPGLKKMDKTTILGETIKYVKRLQENVKTLEELVANRTIESVVVIKKSQLIYDDNSSSVTVAKCKSNSTNGNGGSYVLENINDSLPNIEVKISRNKLLLKIYCENRNGIMNRIFGEFEKHGLSVINCNAVPFESLTLDITIVAQMEIGVNLNVRNFARKVHSALLFSRS